MQRFLRNACIIACKISQRWVNRNKKKMAETARAGFDLEKYTYSKNTAQKKRSMPLIKTAVNRFHTSESTLFCNLKQILCDFLTPPATSGSSMKRTTDSKKSVHVTSVVCLVKSRRLRYTFF